MKLKLEHLGPYLPYGLKVKLTFVPDSELPWYYEDKDLFVLEGMMLDWYNSSNITDIKPLLIPMTEIWNKEYQKQDWAEYIKYDRVKELFVVDVETSTGTMYLKSFVSIMDFLYSNHFDVFGLIDQDLALNKLNYIV